LVDLPIIKFHEETTILLDILLTKILLLNIHHGQLMSE